ncbi:MAG: Export transporter permease protein [Candidatus Binatus sp.]|nr:Export transporter permease protein [Candidatus Binatus sp.]
MLRAVWLTICKEFLLIRRDRVGLFMLLLAPIAVIAAAGFSLAKVYGGESGAVAGYTIAVVDEDRGEVARAILDALAGQRQVKVVSVRDRVDADQLVRVRKLAAIGIVIPAGTTQAFTRGENARLLIYSDPVKYLQTVKIELMLSELCRRITAAAGDQARRMASTSIDNVRAQLERARAAAEQARAEALKIAAESAAQRTAIANRIRAQVQASLAAARDRTRAALEKQLDDLQHKVETETASQQAKLDELKDYLARLEVARGQFEQWLLQLKQIAGSRASKLPAPPNFPTPPSDLNLSQLKIQPIADFAAIKKYLEASLVLPSIQIDLPAIPAPKIPEVKIPALPQSNLAAAIPGTLAYAELDREGRETRAFGGFNAFDLQVPGFAVTFLLIGMLMGVSLALIDEHDWGTLERLRSAWAPLWATLTGKLLARFVVGFAQMVILFAAGWALFGISLGRAPAALMLPASAIAFAGAAFGLVVAGIGRTRDAVLPVGAIVIMTMAAIGGCWWPIDFEPHWMQQIALALPTTWAMRAFNDLMIRDLSASSAIVPSAVNFGFGILYTIVGVAIARRRFG